MSEITDADLTPEQCFKLTGLFDVVKARNMIGKTATGISTSIRWGGGEGMPDDPNFYPMYTKAFGLPTVAVYVEARKLAIKAGWVVAHRTPDGCLFLQLTDRGRQQSIQHGPKGTPPADLTDPELFRLIHGDGQDILDDLMGGGSYGVEA